LRRILSRTSRRQRPSQPARLSGEVLSGRTKGSRRFPPLPESDSSGRGADTLGIRCICGLLVPHILGSTADKYKAHETGKNIATHDAAPRSRRKNQSSNDCRSHRSLANGSYFPLVMVFLRALADPDPAPPRRSRENYEGWLAVRFPGHTRLTETSRWRAKGRSRGRGWTSRGSRSWAITCQQSGGSSGVHNAVRD
jgi:hypothetical protein